MTNKTFKQNNKATKIREKIDTLYNNLYLAEDQLLSELTSQLRNAYLHEEDQLHEFLKPFYENNQVEHLDNYDSNNIFFAFALLTRRIEFYFTKEGLIDTWQSQHFTKPY